MLAKTPQTAPKFSSTDSHVALRLVAARKAAGKTQEQAAAALGLTFQQVQKYEKGKNRITPGKLVTLAAFYSKPVAWFFEGTEADALTSAGVPDLGTQLLAAADGAALAMAFLAITDRAARRTVVDVARALRGVNV